MPGALRERWTITSINPFPKALRVAALDVFDQELLPKDHPLTGLYNVILSPPVAGSSRRAGPHPEGQPVARPSGRATRRHRQRRRDPPAPDGRSCSQRVKPPRCNDLTVSGTPAPA
jgi:hypothetical protein